MVMLFLDGWKYFMGVRTHPEYMEGLKVVPLLMLGKIFLGISYNLSIWYKLTNRNMMAAYVTLAGAGITILINWLFIPRFGYMACGVASLVCYGFMMAVSYTLGQKHYPVPYAWKKLLAYIVICVLLFLVHQVIRHYSPTIWLTHGFGIALSLAFIAFVAKIEKHEIAKIMNN
jgi:O-antigen/teichoic acid export membrane protein